MPTYLIETPHTEEECRIAGEEWLTMDHPRKQEIFDKEYFGCASGVHNAWLVAEFEDEAAAWELVPQIERAKAKVVQVERFTYDEMLKAHSG